MAPTGRNAGPTGDIAPIEDATPAVSDGDKVKAAEADAAAAEEAAKDAPNQRFVQYIVPLVEAAKVVSRPSGEPVADPTAAGRVGVSSAMAQIRPQDWAPGIQTDNTLVWNSENNWRLPAELFSAEQLRQLLVEDRRYAGTTRFELVDGTGEKVDS